MRIWALVAALLIALACGSIVQAQAAEGNLCNVQVKNGLVTFEMKDAPLVEALDRLFGAAGKSYTLTEGARYWIDRSKSAVRLNVRDIPFESALEAVLGDYSYAVENGVYKIIDPGHATQDRIKATGSMDRTGYVPAQQAVLIDIPTMPVEDAYKALVKSAGGDPLGWTFDGKLGKTLMPGASISRLSFRNAAQMLVAAAGLTPPSYPDKVVKTRLRGGFASVFHYEEPVLIRIGGTFAACQFVAFGAYKSGDTWKFTAACDDCWVGDLLYPLFDATGVNYSMSSLTDAQDECNITVRLTDATLDKALHAALDPVGLAYKINSQPGGKAYVIYKPTK